MENSAFITFACIAERAARYPTVVRSSQMRKEVYTASNAPVDRTPLRMESLE